MAEKRQRKTEPESAPVAGVEEVLQRFQEASLRLVQANEAAREAAARESAEAWLEVQGKIHSLEHTRFEAVAEAHRRALAAAGEAGAGDPQAAFAAFAKTQQEFGNEIQRIQAEIEPRLAEIVQEASGERGAGIIDRYVQQRQAAYQAYVGDVQRAWAGFDHPDPQAMSAIAQHVLVTLATVYA